MFLPSAALKIVPGILVALAAIMATLTRLKVTDKLISKFPWLQFAVKFHNAILSVCIALTIIAAVISAIANVKSRGDSVETVMGPDDGLAQIFSYAQFERELSPYPSSMKQEVRDYFRTGERNLQGGGFIEAAEAFRHADGIVKLPSIKLNLGVTLSFTRELPQSILALNEGLGLLAKGGTDPDIEALFRNALGIIYVEEGEAHAAMRESQNVVNMAPQLHNLDVVANARTNIGSILADKGERDNALAQYEAFAWRLRPGVTG